MRAAVRLRNAGGTSPPVPSDVSLTLRGSMGSAAAPRVASLTASDPDNSGPGYSNGDLLTLRFDVAVFVRYRSWTQVTPTLTLTLTLTLALTLTFTLTLTLALSSP